MGKKKKQELHTFLMIKDLREFLKSEEFIKSKEFIFENVDNELLAPQTSDFTKPFWELEVEELKISFEHTYLLNTIAKHFSKDNLKIVLTLSGLDEGDELSITAPLEVINENETGKEKTSSFSMAAGLHMFIETRMPKNSKYLIQFYDDGKPTHEKHWEFDMLFNFKKLPLRFLNERWKDYEFWC